MAVEMNVQNDINRILAEMRNHAISASQANPLGNAEQAGAADFSAMLKQSIGKVNELQQASKSMAESFELGDPTVSLSDAMVSMQKASIAFQAMVQVRNKVISAYQEVMSMPV